MHDAYVSQFEVLPMVKLRLRPSTFSLANGSQLISNAKMNELIEQSSQHYQNHSKIEIVNVGAQVVENSSLYYRVYDGMDVEWEKIKEAWFQVNEALNFVNDLTSPNQIEAVFMNLGDSWCGMAYIAVNAWKMAQYGNDVENTPSRFIQQTKWNNHCNRLDSNVLEHELGHVLSLWHTFQGNELRNDCSNPCRSKANEVNGGTSFKNSNPNTYTYTHTHTHAL